MQTLIEKIFPRRGMLEDRPDHPRAYVRNARHVRDAKVITSHEVHPDAAWSTREMLVGDPRWHSGKHIEVN